MGSFLLAASGEVDEGVMDGQENSAIVMLVNRQVQTYKYRRDIRIGRLGTVWK
jgi:hypothetical protein